MSRHDVERDYQRLWRGLGCALCGHEGELVYGFIPETGRDGYVCRSALACSERQWRLRTSGRELPWRLRASGRELRLFDPEP